MISEYYLLVLIVVKNVSLAHKFRLAEQIAKKTSEDGKYRKC